MIGDVEHTASGEGLFDTGAAETGPVVLGSEPATVDVPIPGSNPAAKRPDLHAIVASHLPENENTAWVSEDRLRNLLNEFIDAL
jgi:hypothetical protein